MMARVRSIVIALALALLASLPAAAQDRVIVRQEPGTPVVAAEVLIAVGPADEDSASEGITYLTARAVTAPILPVLDSLTAQLTVVQHKDAVSFTVIAAPDNWEEATRTLLVALFRDPVDSVATVRQRTATVAELEAREASPADALARQVDAAVFGEDHPWGRPAVGTAASVGRIRVREVDAFLRAGFTADRAVVAIVGPVDRGAADALRAFMDPGPVRRTEVDAPTPADEPVRQQYNSITAWVAAVYPFDEDADEEALRMLASLAVDRVSFGPLRPQVYDSRAEVTRHAGGGELRLELVVPPREAEEWANRLSAAVAEFAGEALGEAQFAERLRRFRGERMLELESPEARARVLARQALATGRTTGRLADVDGLTAARLHQAARSLPDPVIVFLGPFVEEDEEESGGGSSR
jgi:predicted Zn-dependent peptidase